MNTTNEMHSQEIGMLLEALSKAQSVMLGAVEDSANPFFKSTYADLTSVWEACRGPLTKNGLSIVQTMQTTDTQTCLVTILGHISGQWIKSVIPIKPTKPDIQALGSAITYCRRYALAALVGVCPADDDGEKAMDRSKKNVREQVVESYPSEMQLPANIDPMRVEMFMVESARANNVDVEVVRARAAKNMNNMIALYKKWEEKQEVVAT